MCDTSGVSGADRPSQGGARLCLYSEVYWLHDDPSSSALACGAPSKRGLAFQDADQHAKDGIKHQCQGLSEAPSAASRPWPSSSSAPSPAVAACRRLLLPLPGASSLRSRAAHGFSSIEELKKASML